ncbi:hypothetical protein [Dyadobacter psychrotolerans]|uniref:DUF1735 domain-containing protein n=1 Tax=Dyadobacter psychrotolerans TaxID=2541721 RepID=A0A4R5DV92_9BACT|nr:hypothetical protein [Dyadobacter psychrotolerans]TDE16444.1 hypothetical protein E0F88_09400 [Dyadobacter psychrotolerans]
MKRNINKILMSFAFLSSIFLSGCYEEPDLINDISTSVGKVAQISIVWLGTTRNVNPTSLAIIPTLTVDAGASTNFNIEYTSEIPVKEFRVYYAATATGAQTLVANVPAGTQKYDAAIRSYVLAVPIKAQETKGTTRLFFAQIVTENGLLSVQKSTTLTTNK